MITAGSGSEASDELDRIAARIVRDFCGEWFSKTVYQEGIDLKNTSRFLAVAFKKLRSELDRQGHEL